MMSLSLLRKFTFLQTSTWVPIRYRGGKAYFCHDVSYAYLELHGIEFILSNFSELLCFVLQTNL